MNDLLINLALAAPAIIIIACIGWAVFDDRRCSKYHKKVERLRDEGLL